MVPEGPGGDRSSCSAHARRSLSASGRLACSGRMNHGRQRSSRLAETPWKPARRTEGLRCRALAMPGPPSSCRSVLAAACSAMPEAGSARLQPWRAPAAAQVPGPRPLAASSRAPSPGLPLSEPVSGAVRAAGDAGLEAGDAPGMDGSAMPAACASSRAAAAFAASMGSRFSSGESPSISWSMISSIRLRFFDADVRRHSSWGGGGTSLRRCWSNRELDIHVGM